MLQHRLIILLLILVSLVVFWRAASCQFVDFDDFDYVNSRVVQGLTIRNAGWAFTTSHLGYSQPLTWLSLMLDSDLQGAGPRGFHVTNILLHALAAVLLYLALHCLTAAPWRSALVALLFAVHPLRVESVAWISERNCVLSGCLAFAAILAYGAYAHRPSWPRYLLVAVLLTLGLLAKPLIVTLPCLLFLLDVWPLRRMAALPLPPPSAHAPISPPRSPGWLILEKVPLLILTAAESVITYIPQTKGVAFAIRDKLSLASCWANIPISYVRYLGKMVWFRGLIVVYPYHSWPWWQSLGAALLLLSITLAVLIRLRSNPWLAMGWFWFLGMLVPVIGIVPSGSVAMADRYTYVSAVGLTVMLVWSLPDGLFQSRPGRVACSAVTFAVTLVLSAFSWRQIGYWQNTVTLFSHAIEFSPNDYFALNALGKALDQESGQPEQALIYLRRAAEVAPSYLPAQIYLVNLLQRLGQSHKSQAYLDESVKRLETAAKIEPDSAPAYNSIGALYMSMGKLDLALSEFQHAVKLDPNFTLAYLNSGDILAYQRHFDAALAQYRQALRINPYDIDARLQIAKVLMAMGRSQESLDSLRQLIGNRPDMPAAYAAMGQALLQLNQFDEAIIYLQKAVELDPGNPVFRDSLAKAQDAKSAKDAKKN